MSFPASLSFPLSSLFLSPFSVSLSRLSQDWAGFPAQFPPDFGPSLDLPPDFRPPLNFLLPRLISPTLPMYGARLILQDA